MNKIGSWLREEETTTAPREGLDGVVLYFGKPKQKRGKLVRNLGLKTEDGKEFLIRWEDRLTKSITGGNSIEAGASVTIVGATKLDFTPSFCNGMYVDPDSIAVHGHARRIQTFEFELDHIIFFENYVKLDNGTALAYVDQNQWTAQTHISTRAFFNEVKEMLVESGAEPKVTLTGSFKLNYRYDRDARARTERHTLRSSDGNYIQNITATGFERLEEYAAELYNRNRLNDFFEVLRQRAESAWVMRREYIQAVIDSENVGDLINIDDVQNRLVENMQSAEYDLEYFQFLKSVGELEGVNDEGFFFKLSENYYAFEIPIASKATYIFKGHPTEITNNIKEIQDANVPTEMVTRDEIRTSSGSWKMPLIRMKSANPEELQWFVKRIIHTENFNRWTEEVSEFTHS